jgi:NAD(P)-dependent dehydrogenase (short-subunit alcohol dehydrogenase family)
MTMNRLEGKRAVITGATGGIGEAAARRLLAEGATVMLAARSTERLATVAERLRSDKVYTCATDVSIEKDCKALAENSIAVMGGIDILFANAGFEGSIKPLLEIEQEEFDAVQNTNIRGTWLTMKHCIPNMLTRGGSVVVTSSVAGKVGIPGLGAYVASKHALIGLVEVASLELAEHGVRVNAIAPAPIDNAMMRSIEEQAAPGSPQAAKQGFEALIALKRYGTDEEVAAMVAFLASDDASFCTGGVYPIDGGFLAQ